eukprot:351125-Chlamydomonas_euryale.AAC.3
MPPRPPPLPQLPAAPRHPPTLRHGADAGSDGLFSSAPHPFLPHTHLALPPKCAILPQMCHPIQTPLAPTPRPGGRRMIRSLVGSAQHPSFPSLHRPPRPSPKSAATRWNHSIQLHSHARRILGPGACTGAT